MLWPKPSPLPTASVSGRSNHIGRQHCDLYFQFVRLSRLTIMWIVVITWATLCAASFSRTPWNCHCRWQIEQILANRTMLTLSPAFFASREICFGEILVRKPCPCPSVEVFVWFWIWGRVRKKKGATCQEKGKNKRGDGVQKGSWGYNFTLLQTIGKHGNFHFFSFYQMAPPLPLTLTICDERLLPIQRRAIWNSGRPFICWRLSVDNRFIMRASSN